ncbi:hypothetical protein AGDE_12196 [Angomonas deanei]|nr:hypothetical protein AGDE_12196 [Angomonas deanei]|eukprot:EPY24738.1 hypothetical protein AGDE_12196 [Angomonas deanei]
MSVVHHPFDVLRATADARQGPRLFTGPWDVLKTALKERPAVLLGLYKGFAMNGMSTSLRYSTQFGVYNALRYDGVYRHPLVLFAYCHMGAFLGMLIQYPFLAIKQQLRIVNSLNGGKYPHNYRSYISQVKRQHGVTKLFEGFFTGKPVLNAVPPALLMTLYDIGVRRYTEYLHPELRTVATPEQSLMHIKSPSYPVTDSSYEFTPRR